MINAISFYNNIIPARQERKYSYPCQSLKPLGRDTVCFTSSKLLNKDSKEITETVKQAIEEKNKIGFGTEGAVYKIPDTEYCVKLPKYESVNNFGEWGLKVDAQDKINHVVAVAQNGSTIMKYIDGKALEWENKPSEIYNLPKESYRNLMSQIKDAFDECLQFDSASSNVIFNKKDNSLTAIDFYEPSPDIDYHYRPLSSIFTALESHSESIPQRNSENRKLVGKLLNVALDELSGENKLEIERYDVFQVLGLLHITQQKEESPQMRVLSDSLNTVFRLQREPQTQESGKIINKNVNVARAVIEQVLSE